jgi:hypothetical protein
VYHAASGGLKTASFYNDGVGLSLHPDRLKRYPGFAMVFFLVAAAGAIWLAFTILSTDRPARRR